MKASVVIPAYNAEKTIGKCLDSLQSQSFKDFEAIVVDDESNDRTAEAAKKFPKARVLRQKHAGPAVARNFGTREAKGGIVVFTDSDCVLDRDWLAEMLKPFDDASIVGVQGSYKSNQKEIVARLIQLEIENRHEKMANKKDIDFMGTYSAAYRKSVFMEMKGFDESFPIASGEDTDLSFRINEAGYRMVFNPKAIVFHRHPTSLLKYLKVKFFRAYWRTKVYKRHKAKMVNDAYTSNLIKVQIALFLLGIFLAAFSVLVPIYLNWTLLVFALLFLSTLRFATWAIARDPLVGLVSPFTEIARTMSFSAGLFLGTLRELFGK